MRAKDDRATVAHLCGDCWRALSEDRRDWYSELPAIWERGLDVVKHEGLEHRFVTWRERS